MSKLVIPASAQLDPRRFVLFNGHLQLLWVFSSNRNPHAAWYCWWKDLVRIQICVKKSGMRKKDAQCTQADSKANITSHAIVSQRLYSYRDAAFRCSGLKTYNGTTYTCDKIQVCPIKDGVLDCIIWYFGLVWQTQTGNVCGQCKLAVGAVNPWQ